MVFRRILVLPAVPLLALAGASAAWAEPIPPPGGCAEEIINPNHLCLGINRFRRSGCRSCTPDTRGVIRRLAAYVYLPAEERY